MTPDHFQLDDIKNPFWREFMGDLAAQTTFEDAVIVYVELQRRSGGDLPYIAYEPVRLARDRAIRAGDDVEAYLSPRRFREIKSQPE